MELAPMVHSSLAQSLERVIRDVPNFPKPGVIFKDITPILQDHTLCHQIVEAFYAHYKQKEIDVVVGVESRGFLFGLMLASRLGVPFVPIRKQGRLPADTIACEYDLEYGSATVEIHADAFSKGSRALIHDDLLATGGTVLAASQLVERLGGSVAGYAFIINLDFLGGAAQLKQHSADILSLVNFE